MRASRVLIAALLLVLAALPAAAAEPADACQAIQSWVAGLDRLPADYASFTALPAGHQKAVYHQLTDAERVALWQHQWQEAMLAGNLTDGQKALVAETSRMMTEDLFAAMRAKEGGEYEAAKVQVATLKARLAAAFPRPAYVSLFAHLGDAKAAVGRTLGLVPVCNCNLFVQECSCQPISCSSYWEGCGDFGYDACDGYCW